MPGSERKSLLEEPLTPRNDSARSRSGSTKGFSKNASAAKSGPGPTTIRTIVLGCVVLLLIVVALWLRREPAPEVTPEELAAESAADAPPPAEPEPTINPTTGKREEPPPLE